MNIILKTTLQLHEITLKTKKSVFKLNAAFADEFLFIYNFH